jgi:hypothetical protein
MPSSLVAPNKQSAVHVICVLQKDLAMRLLCITLICMRNQNISCSKTSAKRIGIVPSLFCGAPVAFVLAGVLANFVPALAALAIGAAVGALCGRSLLKAI